MPPRQLTRMAMALVTMLTQTMTATPFWMWMRPRVARLSQTAIPMVLERLLTLPT